MTDITPQREPLYWKHELVGYIENPTPDMYYLEGSWIPLDTAIAPLFSSETSDRDLNYLKDIMSGVREPNEANAIWVGLGENKPNYMFIACFEDKIVLRVSSNPPQNW